MLKQLLIIPVIALMLFSLIVSAQEALQQEQTSEQQTTGLPEGYTGIQATRRGQAFYTTIYNPADLAAVFGIAPEVQDNALRIRYRTGTGANARDVEFGILAGRIIKTGANIIEVSRIEESSTMAVYTSSDKKYELKAYRFAIDATDPQNNKFAFKMLESAAFTIDFTPGNSPEAKDMKSVVCRGICDINVAVSPADIYFDISEGAILLRRMSADKTADSLSDYMSGRRDRIPVAYVNVSSLKDARIKPRPPGYGGFSMELTAKEMRSDMSSMFESINFSSAEEAGFKWERVSGGAHVIGMSAANARAYLTGDAELTAAGLQDGGIRVSIHPEIREIFELKRGRMAVSLNAEQADCPGEDGNGGRVFIDNANSRLVICPRQFYSENGGDGISAPLKLELLDPASVGFTSLYFDKFLRQGENGDLVSIAKQGNSLMFGYDKADIIPSGDWFQFGLGFDTYPILIQEEPTQGEAAGSNAAPVPYRFMCNIAARACYIKDSEGTMTEVMSFSERKVKKCSEDADCSHGNVCIDNTCRVPATCDKLIESSETAGSPINVLFISEGYSNAEYSLFQEDVKKILTDASFDGLFSVPPFDEFKDKFAVWTIKGGRASGSLESISGTYLIEYARQCSNDYTVVLSKNQHFRDHSSARAGTSTISMSDANSYGNARTFVHEFGHAFGILADEYFTEDAAERHAGIMPPNCLYKEHIAGFWGESLANRAIRERWNGCGGDCPITLPECQELKTDAFRPSENSIMRNHQEVSANDKEHWFNEPSKKQIRGIAEGKDMVEIWGDIAKPRLSVFLPPVRTISTGRVTSASGGR